MKILINHKNLQFKIRFIAYVPEEKLQDERAN